MLNAIQMLKTPIRSGVTPLMKAVKDGDEAAVQMLLSRGADANAADSYGETSLYHAANDCRHHGKLAIMRLLLKAGADPNAANSYRQTALYYPACCGRLETARLLLEAGADPNVAEKNSGETPLVTVVSFGWEAMVQMLLSHGADANATDCCGRTSLYHAACYCQGHIMYLLYDDYFEENERMTESICTIKRIRTEMITHLLKHRADPNLVDRNKRTPLAIIGSRAEVRSPDISECVDDKELPEAVESVVQSGSVFLQTCESVGVLLQVNTRDSEGDTPLHSFCRVMLACKDNFYAPEREGCVQIVHALLFNHGAHVDVVNARGETPYEVWRRIHPTRFLGNVESMSNEIHGRMTAQYHLLKCHCARVIVRHNVAYENRLPPSLMEFVRVHARPM